MTATIEDLPTHTGHERVLFCRDPEAGYRGVIAIHSTAAGGCAELLGWGGGAVKDRVERIYDTLLEVLRLAGEQDVPPHAAADRLVERRLADLEGGAREWK